MKLKLINFGYRVRLQRDINFFRWEQRKNLRENGLEWQCWIILENMTKWGQFRFNDYWIKIKIKFLLSLILSSLTVTKRYLSFLQVTLAVVVAQFFIVNTLYFNFLGIKIHILASTTDCCALFWLKGRLHLLTWK